MESPNSNICNSYFFLEKLMTMRQLTKIQALQIVEVKINTYKSFKIVIQKTFLKAIEFLNQIINLFFITNWDFKDNFLQCSWYPQFLDLLVYSSDLFSNIYCISKLCLYYIYRIQMFCNGKSAYYISDLQNSLQTRESTLNV